MIHSGAVVAAGISQGKAVTFKYDFKVSSFCFHKLSNSHSTRQAPTSGMSVTHFITNRTSNWQMSLMQ